MSVIEPNLVLRPGLFAAAAGTSLPFLMHMEKALGRAERSQNRAILLNLANNLFEKIGPV